MHIENALAQEEMFDLLEASAFTNVIPKPPAKSTYYNVFIKNILPFYCPLLASVFEKSKILFQ